jgi:hypothetical protein
MEPPRQSEEPLRQRLPRYASWLVVEVAAAFLIALVVWWLTDLSWTTSIGGTLVGTGALSLLAGGASGGGFVTAGDYGTRYGQRHHQGWDSTAGEIGRAQDLRDRLAAHLRPRRNPAAWWQVIGGLALIGLGIVALAFSGT